MTENPNKQPLLSADLSFIDPAKDQLGYAPFAMHLALSLVRMAPTDGLVIAVYGAWGSGKSTFVGFIEHTLTHLSGADKQKEPIIVHFNPWWFSGHEDLARIFFRELQAALEDDKSFKDIRKALTKYSGALSSATTFVTETVSRSETLGKAAGGAVANHLDAVNNQSIPDLKRRLEEKLRKAGKRIVVVIDDIDRLTADEIRQLFRVVKAVANFPNIIYLLAFDKKVVVNALTDTQNIPGEEYLEKIVQVPIELPLPAKDGIRKLFVTQLREILPAIPEASSWGMLEEGYEAAIRLLATPRDVFRLANAVAITYPAVAGEVNDIDLVGIETLRVFSPVIYNVVRQHSFAFAGSNVFRTRPAPIDTIFGSPSSRDLEAEPTYYDRILEQIEERDRFEILQLLEYLFPKLISARTNTEVRSDSTSEWDKQFRICSPIHFDTYFRFAISTDMLRQAERSRILDLANTDPSGLISYLAAIVRDASYTKAEQGLYVIATYPERLTGVPALIEVLLSKGDELLRAVEISSWAVALSSATSDVVITLLKHEAKWERRRFVEQQRGIYSDVPQPALVQEAERYKLLEHQLQVKVFRRLSRWLIRRGSRRSASQLSPDSVLSGTVSRGHPADNGRAAPGAAAISANLVRKFIL